LLQSLNTFARHYGKEWTLECPTGSGKYVTIAEAGDEIAKRMCRIFLRDTDGKRPVFGGNHYFNNDPHWRDYVPFYEYFHAENGSGLGASHQTGWTALVAILLQHGGALHFDVPISSNPGVAAEVAGKHRRRASSLEKPATLQAHSVYPGLPSSKYRCEFFVHF
jgi:hypothetical protein